eukprot:GILJ01002304.1.p1 GENE.GILJ01002304.1~~GILJ01002304.1.p1  ORF type:complete len:174 (-),score=17.23 GILJ01002304.1:115-636(-)
MFNRALGVVIPRETESDLFDVTYLRCGDHNVDKTLEEQIETFCNRLDSHGHQHGQLILSFYESRLKKGFFGLSKQEEKVVWEQWLIPIRILFTKSSLQDPAERSRRQDELEHALNDRILWIVRKVNEKRDHIPPVTISADSITCFPFEIIIPSATDSSWNFDVFRMLRPPLLN